MKKIICIFMCMMVLIGCSSKKEDNSISNESSQSEVTEDIQEENQNKTDYYTYPMYTGAKTEEGAWYYNVPVLNEIHEGLGVSYINSDEWWICYSLDIMTETDDLDIGYEQSLYAFYHSAMRTYYEPENGEFIPETKERVNISGLDMYKIEGYSKNAKYSEGNPSNCWIYGYTFIIGGTPCGIFGMTFKDNSEETKELITMYVDDMAKSLRAGND